jgi:hypothetical protein
MRPHYCRQEQALIAGLQSGEAKRDLRLHAESCPVRGDSFAISEALTEEATSLDPKVRPPDAGLIWRRALQRAREQTVANATLPIRITLTCTAVITVISCPWLIAFWMRLAGGLPLLRSLSFLDGNWVAAFPGTITVLTATTLICIALSSWWS